MVRSRTSVDLFHYLDYRQFLRNWYRTAKRTRPTFSFRAFSKRAGFRSPNFLKLVMDGDRNLTEASLVKFVAGLQLNKQEQDFFRNLVFFTQATTHDQRDTYYQRLLQSRKYHQLKPLERDQYEYYATWYHPVVRELIAAPDWDGSIAALARRVAPSITVQQAEKSLELLEKLGLIERTPNGRWRQTATLVSTGAEVSSLTLLNYHRNLLDLTKVVLDTITPDQRDVSALTLGITRSRLPELKRRTQLFRQEILKWVAADAAPELVVQLDIQCFPLSRGSEKTS